MSAIWYSARSRDGSLKWCVAQGLTEPFEEKYKDIRSATILTLLASSTFCGLVGFALGRYLGGGSEKRR